MEQRHKALILMVYIHWHLWMMCNCLYKHAADNKDLHVVFNYNLQTYQPQPSKNPSAKKTIIN